MTPDAAREALYRRLYAVWPEWTDAPLTTLAIQEVAEHLGALLFAGRIELLPDGSAVRVNMRLAA